MTKRVAILFVVSAMVAGIATGGSKQRGVQKPVTLDEAAQPASGRAHFVPEVNPPARPPVGTYTTLNGFYDYQCNGAACQHIRVNPANGNIHVVYMIATDSTDLGATSRRTAYAFSTNGGTSWNNFTDVRIPSRRSGFGTIDLLQGPNAGLPVIANHNDPTGGVRTEIYVDSPEGSGAFSELNSPPLINAGGDEPIWPFVAGPSDGSIVVHSSRQTAATNHLTRSNDFATWSPWLQFPGTTTNNQGGRYSTQANGTGRVGTLLNAVNSGVLWLESTDNGATWPATSTQLYPPAPPGRIAGADTFQAWVGSDLVYNGNNALIAINELNIGANDTTDGAQIVFWSQATGFKTAATRANTPGTVANLNRAQTNHFSLGYPAIGLSGNRIVIAYQAFSKDTSAVGFNFSDVWWVQSTDGGNTWSAPRNVTNTTNLDERYPSISKWNQTGFANITWQEDTQPGSYVFTDGAPGSHPRQVFYKVSLTTDVAEGSGIAQTFKLEQNYPNPFNPSTTIAYNIPVGSNVSLKVYNALGQQVANLVDEYRAAGNYEANFSASNLASGVYFYTLKAGSFSATKKMLLMK